MAPNMPADDDVTPVRIMAVVVDDERIEFSLSDGLNSQRVLWTR